MRVVVVAGLLLCLLVLVQESVGEERLERADERVKEKGEEEDEDMSRKKGDNNKRKCKTFKKCKKLGGECANSCKKKEEAVDKGCKGTCTCCVPKCKPLKKCTKAAGTCVRSKKDCDGDIIKKKGCKGGCLCCAPKCVPKKSCKQGGGYCVKKEKECDGLFVKKGCKSKPKGAKCHCCLPLITTTPGTTTSPGTTTTPA